MFRRWPGQLVFEMIPVSVVSSGSVWCKFFLFLCLYLSAWRKSRWHPALQFFWNAAGSQSGMERRAGSRMRLDRNRWLHPLPLLPHLYPTSILRTENDWLWTKLMKRHLTWLSWLTRIIDLWLRMPRICTWRSSSQPEVTCSPTSGTWLVLSMQFAICKFVSLFILYLSLHWFHYASRPAASSFVSYCHFYFPSSSPPPPPPPSPWSWSCFCPADSVPAIESSSWR